MSAFISYAQNFEDVLLWRALGHVPNGFYVDIGANDPISDSVSKGFYEKGWRGIHVEPVLEYAERLRRDRPDELVIQAAIGTGAGLLTFFDIPNTGMSTAVPSIAEKCRREGYEVKETAVPCLRLDDLLSQVSAPEIHWLKIDVEGYEKNVLDSWSAKRRPWILVVEATVPQSQEEVHHVWEPLILEKGYLPVFADGLNRYYLAQEHGDLKDSFRYGANVFDGFEVDDSCWIARNVVRRRDRMLAESLEERALRLADSEKEIERVRQEARDKESALVEAEKEIERVRQDARDKESALVEAEKEIERVRQEALTLGSALAGAEKETDRVRLDARTREAAQLSEMLERERYFSDALLRRDDDARAERLRHAEDLRAMEAARLRLVERAHVSSRQVAYLRERLRNPFLLVRYWLSGGGDFPVEGPLVSSMDERQILDVDQLLTLNGDDAFLDAAYRTILGRGGDPEGLAYYRGKLSEGISRETVIAQLRLSSEGRRVHASLSGLASLLRRYRWRKLRLSGFFRRRGGARQSLPLEMDADQLLALHDEAFVVAAYRSVLKRAPDPEGLEYYLAQVRDGTSRRDILARLRTSPEGRSVRAVVPKLTGIVRSYRWQAVPCLGKLLPRLGIGEPRSEYWRRIRAVENLMYRVESQSETRRHDVESIFDAVRGK